MIYVYYLKYVTILKFKIERLEYFIKIYFYLPIRNTLVYDHLYLVYL